jgi:hypothetical protein
MGEEHLAADLIERDQKIPEPVRILRKIPAPGLMPLIVFLYQTVPASPCVWLNFALCSVNSRHESEHGILIRACKERRDYTGGSNHFVALTLLDDISALAASVRAITGIGRPTSSTAAQSRAA